MEKEKKKSIFLINDSAEDRKIEDRQFQER